MTAPPAPRPLAAAAALAALAACATLRASPLPRDPSLLSERPARLASRACRTDPAPRTLPAAGELVDTAALAADIARLPADGPLPGGYVLLSMGYARDGANVRREVIEHGVDPRLADTLQKLVFVRRRALPPGVEEWGVRLRIDLGAEARFRVGRRELCAPHPRGRGVPTLPGWADASGADPFAQDLPASQTVWVRVSLDELGRVTDATLERGPLRRGRSEWLLLSYVRNLTFEPAAEDGRPVPAVTSVPVRVPA